MPSARIYLLLVAVVLAIPSVAQNSKPPAEVDFLSTWGKIQQRYPYENFGQSTFPHYGENQINRRGRHWDLWVPIPGSYKDRYETWAAVKPTVVKSGWTIISENPHGGLLIVLRYNQNGVDAWANASVDDGASPMRFTMDLIEVTPPPISMTLHEPAQTPEKMPTGGKGDFPYLTPMPGSVAHGGQEEDTPFRLTPKGASQDEIVANGSVLRNYSLNDGSQILFVAVYHDALLKAGWDIEQETPNAEVIVAHYGKHGRNLWAYLIDHGEEYSFRVGKEAAPDQMKSKLIADCHVAIYGVLFDFNKATLQPESDGPLGQVGALLTANSSLNVEVQGHTDNVGTDAYNQTLSEARAKSVMTWLTQHGVAPGRMTAKGYGKTMPVADNKTDDGRMKNRRVEIADPKCKAGK
ncbi:outer membrane protein, OmpA/MotB family [Candidatus Koribacter versatilis Ellin345]|uniref:Outer membrane protein, OmpA/MotB family n=1 Tax=Koribacter versatilis (strain Ellin345) TaxID=204669 RepID=Q1IJK1_KORVE|nr:OmpA family protein [Candidatus Koribacter versatilis]ABF42949.1 outer membrane protein, OmpA/MotB family [Candidatus Koribacter versatilis Ellin345]